MTSPDFGSGIGRPTEMGRQFGAGAADGGQPKIGMVETPNTGAESIRAVQPVTSPDFPSSPRSPLTQPMGVPRELRGTDTAETRQVEGQADMAAQPGIRTLYRGAWVESFSDGDKVPVGGSIFSDEFNTTLTVDIAWMDERLERFTPERIKEAFDSDNRANFERIIEDNQIQIGAETYHTLYQVQRATDRLLQVGGDPVSEQRFEAYKSGNAKLSDLVGKAQCAERAAVGKIFLSRLGIPSTMMAGIAVDGKKEEPLEHAYLFLDDPQGEGSLVFDISRPWKELNGYPRILRSERKITYEDFVSEDNYVVPADDIITGQRLYFGVGNPSILQDVRFADDPL